MWKFRQCVPIECVAQILWLSVKFDRSIEKLTGWRHLHGTPREIALYSIKWLLSENNCKIHEYCILSIKVLYPLNFVNRCSLVWPKTFTWKSNSTSQWTKTKKVKTKNALNWGNISPLKSTKPYHNNYYQKHIFRTFKSTFVWHAKTLHVRQFFGSIILPFTNITFSLKMPAIILWTPCVRNQLGWLVRKPNLAAGCESGGTGYGR